MNQVLWFIPLHLPDGNPVGDGVLWPVGNHGEMYIWIKINLNPQQQQIAK